MRAIVRDYYDKDGGAKLSSPICAKYYRCRSRSRRLNTAPDSVRKSVSPETTTTLVQARANARIKKERAMNTADNRHPLAGEQSYELRRF